MPSPVSAHPQGSSRRRGGKPCLYEWTPSKDDFLRSRYDSRVRRRTHEIAHALGMPVWAIKRRAQILGLAQPWPATRRNWTAEEMTLLEQYAGQKHVTWLAKRLKRPVVSVVLKLKRMGLRRRVTEGYTLRDLQECLGLDHRTIERFVREGKLRVRRRNPEAQQRSPWMVTDKDLLAFIRQHPTAINLAKVDALWFLDLVLGTNLMDHAA